MPKSKKKKTVNICGECKRANRPAINAAKLGHTQCLTTAYRELGVFNERDDYGATPIHFAARFGKLECLVWLVTRSGVSPNAVSRSGATAAHDAAAMGHLDCLQYLIKNTRCSIEDATSEGATVLHMACRFGRLEVVKWLMEYSGSSPSEKGANNVTPVHLCAAKNHLECLKWLIQHPKYVPNEQTAHGATPVYFAAQEGSVRCLQWLTEQGEGDPYTTAADGMGPIHAAAQAGQIKCLEYLVKKATVPIRHRAEDSATPAHFAAASGQVECLEWILDNGGSMHDRDNLGGTPVHDAAEQGQILALSSLIRHGADLDAEDNEGLKPVDLARNNNYEDCFNLLFKAVKPNILVSLTPHQSLTRASAEDEEQMRLRAEKQRRFEEAMLGEISEERKEAIWQSAQQKASNVQPGLKLILEGQTESSPSSFNVEISVLEASANKGSAIQLTPTGSMRHSRHSSKRSAAGRQVDEDFLPDDIQPYKPRPHLTPDLFKQPSEEEQTLTTESKDKGTDVVGTGVVLRNKPDTSDEVRKSQYRQSADSPIPPRAKFLKKFGVKKPSRSASTKATEKKAARKQSVEHKQGLLSKKLSSSSVGQKSSAKLDKTPTGKLTKQKSGSGVQQQRPITKKLSKSKVTESQERQAQRKVSKSKQSTKDAPLVKGKVAVSKKSPKQKKPKQEVKEEEKIDTSKGASVERRMSSDSPYMFFASTFVDSLMQESIPKDSADKRTEQPELDVKTSPTDQALDTTETEVVNIEGIADDSTTASPGEEVVLRTKKKSKQMFEEVAVISKPDVRKSLKSPDETVTVSFIPKATNIKQLTEDDLSSPGSSDDEETQRESLTVPGFERLNPQTFKEFGEDVKDLELSQKEKERKWEEEDNRESYHDEAQKTRPGEDKVEEEKGKDDKQSKDEKKTTSGQTSSEKAKDQDAELESDSQTRLVRWNKQQTLHEADEASTAKQETLKSSVERQEKSELEKRNILPTKTSAVYYKYQDFSQLKKERGYTDVLKMVSQMQSSKSEEANSAASDRSAPRGPSKLGNVSAKLKMFGGGASFVKPPPLKKDEPTLSTEDKSTAEELSMAEKPSLSHTEESKPPESPTHKSPPSGTPSDNSPPHASTQTEVSSVIQPRHRYRSTGSLISITTFETIKEEDETTDTEPDDLERVESIDLITPLPKIPPSLSRRHSEELLRLDGIQQSSKEESSTASSQQPGGKESPTRSRAVELREKETRRSPSPTKRRHSGGSSVYSPLMQSSDATSVQKRETSDQSDKPRPLSVPPSPPKGSEAMSLYMNSANLPHLNHVKVKHEKSELSAAEDLADALLSKPKFSADQVPLEFKHLKLAEGRPKIYAWKQKAGSLQKLVSLDSVSFGEKEVYIFLYMAPHGPLLYHVFLWVGKSVNDFALHSAYQHSQNLVNTLPGLPVVHKEFQGYETFLFTNSLEIGGLPSSLKPTITLLYLNQGLRKAKVYSYENATSSFEAIPSAEYSVVMTMTTPVVMDTPTHLYLWLPKGELYLQKTPLEIAEMFIIHNSYPKWTPVTVMIQDGETEEFMNQFKFRPSVKLSLAAKSAQLYLPTIRPPEVTYPVTGQTKVWKLADQEMKQLSLDQFGHFNSSSVYLVQYVYNKHSALFTWVEGMVYVWVGEDVRERRAEIVKQAYEKCKTIGPNSKMPVVIVPEGKEPSQLLNLFKGKFIVHKATSGTKLYQVSGESALAMKAVEVPAKSSSLHSCHTYLLLSEDGKLYAWSGQFSSKVHRRGALVIAKMLSAETDDSVRLAEGLEPPEFWSQLGGKSKYPQFISAEYPLHTMPVLYSCEMRQGMVLFTQLYATKKEDLKSDISYLLSYKDKLFIREGGYWKKGIHQLNVVQTFVQRYHSWKDESDFVTTLVTEGNEGEMFWKWFDIQNLTPVSGDVAVEKQEQQIESAEDSTDGKEEAVQLRDPPTSQPLALTKSQEVAFEKVEKLQTQLESLVEASKKESSQEGSEEEEEAKKITEGADEKSKKAKESPFRTSQTVNALGNLIVGLDDILKSNSKTKVDKPTGEPHAEDGSSTSLQPPPISKLLSQTEISEGKATKKETKDASNRLSRASAKSPVSLVVTVEVADDLGVFNVSVKEKAPVISVIFKTAKVAGITLKPESALFEVSESLKIQRPLEDHELIKDVMAQWPTKNRPKLVLRDFATKNLLWFSHPPIPKQAITAYVKNNKVPEVTSQMLYCKKGGSKLNWKEGNFFLRALGIYNIVETRKASKIDLFSSLDHHVYTPIMIQGKGYETPNRFCFVMKPPNSWKDKDLRFYCVADIRTMAKWVHTIRLLKHGLQLKGNFIAMKTRLQKLAIEPQKSHSTQDKPSE